MNGGEDRLARAYGFLLRLYPTRFRAEFEEEMRAVFAGRLADAARRGAAAQTALLLAELLATPRALLSAYRLRSYRPGLSPGWRQRLLAILLAPPIEPGPDGRSSFRQATAELIPFLLAALALATAGYLPLFLPELTRAWPSPGLLAAVRLLPWLPLAAGLLHGMPRWAFPWAGLALGSGAMAAVESRALPALTLALAGGGLAALLARALFRQQRVAPAPSWLSHAAAGLSANPARAAFGLYGLLPLALRLGFDDGFLDYRTPFLALAVVWMLAGALGFIRAGTPGRQAAALLAGQTGALGAALLDLAAFNHLAASGPWIGWLWLSLTALTGAPFLLRSLSGRAAEAAK